MKTKEKQNNMLSVTSEIRCKMTFRLKIKKKKKSAILCRLLLEGGRNRATNKCGQYRDVQMSLFYRKNLMYPFKIPFYSLTLLST